MQAQYRPPFWLLGRHLQTIYPAAWLPLPDVTYRREEWSTPDGDFIELDWLTSENTDDKAKPPNTQPIVVMFHGLEGNSKSHYALRLMAALREKNWRGVVVHFRGCGGKPNQLPRGYHCGDSAEIDWILRRLRSNETGPIYAVGVSLGGNALLKWLGEQQENAQAIIAKAIAVSAPLALPTTGHVLGSGFNKIYARLFLKTLRPKALAMIEKYQLGFDTAALQTVDNLWHYDDLFTAPLHGFASADDYWEKSNSRPYLKSIQLPTLLINARNDPFLPAKDLPTAAEVSSSVIREFPSKGGHAGFVSSLAGKGHDWLPQRMLCFFNTGN